MKLFFSPSVNCIIFSGAGDQKERERESGREREKTFEFKLKPLSSSFQADFENFIAEMSRLKIIS